MVPEKVMIPGASGGSKAERHGRLPRGAALRAAERGRCRRFWAPRVGASGAGAAHGWRTGVARERRTEAVHGRGLRQWRASERERRAPPEVPVSHEKCETPAAPPTTTVCEMIPMPLTEATALLESSY